MLCKKCGAENNIENNFCINCGTRLEKTEQSEVTVCIACGTTNDVSNNFCISCGRNLKTMSSGNSEEFTPAHQTKSSSKKRKNKHNSTLYAQQLPQKKLELKPILISVIVLVISYLIYIIIDSQLDKSRIYEQTSFEVKSSNPAVEAKVYELATKFVCSCGTCNEESLEKCTCQRAIEERQFIRDYLERNGNPDDIVIALANKYGYLKAEYAKNYKVDKSKTWAATNLQYPQNVANNIISNNLNTKATYANLIEIYSAFNCPCGQCRIDELKDCNCNHPNGATEVKKFINDKISENRYTINQIIELVNNKYGGKKI